MTPDDLYELRYEIGFTQQEMADMVKTTRSSISRYENGERRITPQFLLALEYGLKRKRKWHIGKKYI